MIKNQVKYIKMKDTDEIFSQEKVKENGEKVRLVAYFSGTVEITINGKLTTIATIENSINVTALIYFSDEEKDMVKDFFDDLLKVDIALVVEKTIKIKYKASLN